MEYTRLRISRVDGVGHIELSRPEEFNRMPPAFWEEFPAAVAEMDAGGDVRVVILSSTGKHFSSGMDLAVFTEARAPMSRDRGRLGEAGRRGIGRFQDAFNVLQDVRMPVIAAVQGACMGGGVDMVAACDMRYCTADAFFCIQEINIGLAADVGTLQRLPLLIPDGLMRELAYTGRRMYAEEAKEVGLVNAVFETHESMLETVRGIAGQIASKSPLAVTSTKHLLNYGREHGVRDSLAYQQVWMGAVSHGGDMARYFDAKSRGEEAEYEDLPPLPSANVPGAEGTP